MEVPKPTGPRSSPALTWQQCLIQLLTLSGPILPETFQGPCTQFSFYLAGCSFLGPFAGSFIPHPPPSLVEVLQALPARRLPQTWVSANPV